MKFFAAHQRKKGGEGKLKLPCNISKILGVPKKHLIFRWEKNTMKKIPGSPRWTHTVESSNQMLKVGTHKGYGAKDQRKCGVFQGYTRVEVDGTATMYWFL